MKILENPVQPSDQEASLWTSSRRSFLRKSLTSAAAILTGAQLLGSDKSPTSGVDAIRGFGITASGDPWKDLRSYYDLPGDVVQLDHGYWGVMSQPVFENYLNLQKIVNRQGPVYGRLQFPKDIAKVQEETASLLGIDADELILSRGATEALQTLIADYNELQSGDEVLYSDHDYDSMQHAMDWLVDRRGVTVRRIELPNKPSYESLIQTYEDAFKRYPRVKLVLLTHVCHRNGLVLPVKEIHQLAKEHGMETIIDAAHSLGQVDFKIRDLEANFVGLSLHKWMGAPMGTGLIYIRKGNAHRIDPHFRKIEADNLNVQDRLHTGTVNFASFLAIPEAIRFYQTIPVSLRHEHLRSLQKLWTDRFRNDPRVEVLNAEDPRLNTGMAAFRMTGKGDYESNLNLTRQLWEKARVLTVLRVGLASGVCIRVTPAPYTRPDEVQTFADTLDQLV